MYMKNSRYRAKKSYEASTDNPLIVTEGERLIFERRPTEWPGWLWCETESDQSGWVPESWVEIYGSICVMRVDYDATELTVEQGEELTGRHVESGWIWVSNHLQESGWVPLDHLEEI
jgi:hypothetical protein